MYEKNPALIKSAGSRFCDFVQPPITANGIERAGLLVVHCFV